MVLGALNSDASRYFLMLRTGWEQSHPRPPALHDLKLKPTILTAAEADALENELNIYEPVTVDELLARSGLEAQSAPAGKPRRYKLAATGVASDAGNE